MPAHQAAPFGLPIHNRGVGAFPIDLSTNELALARSRLNALLEKQRDSPPEAWLGFGMAVWRYINTIMARTQKNSIRGRDQRTSFIAFLETIREANEPRWCSDRLCLREGCLRRGWEWNRWTPGAAARPTFASPWGA